MFKTWKIFSIDSTAFSSFTTKGRKIALWKSFGKDVIDAKQPAIAKTYAWIFEVRQILQNISRIQYLVDIDPDAIFDPADM